MNKNKQIKGQEDSLLKANKYTNKKTIYVFIKTYKYTNKETIYVFTKTNK